LLIIQEFMIDMNEGMKNGAVAVQSSAADGANDG
jgi:hypothetical protein